MYHKLFSPEVASYFVNNTSYKINVTYLLLNYFFFQTSIICKGKFHRCFSSQNWPAQYSSSFFSFFPFIDQFSVCHGTIIFLCHGIIFAIKTFMFNFFFPYYIKFCIILKTQLMSFIRFGKQTLLFNCIGSIVINDSLFVIVKVTNSSNYIFQFS